MMDIVCPNCAAAYEIDSASVGETGRKVRCAACSTVWRVFLPEPAPAGPAMDWDATPSGVTVTPETPALAETNADLTTPPEEPVQPAGVQAALVEEAPPKKPSRAKWSKGKKTNARKSVPFKKFLSWPAGVIAATLVVAAAGLHQRENIVRLLPQTARIYAAIGMPVNLRGITIKGVASRIIDDNGVSVLVVDGDLVNTTDRKIDVPRLRFAVIGQDGQEVYAWSAQADRTSLQPGEKLNFRRRLAAPPADGKDVSVRFVTRSDITSGIK